MVGDSLYIESTVIDGLRDVSEIEKPPGRRL